MRLISRLIVLLAALLPGLLAPPALAADVDFPAPDTAVNEFGITTYLDLARHFVTDIKPSDSGYVGTTRIPVRHIAGKDYDNDGLKSFGFYDISTVRMKANGKDRLLVLFDFAQAAKSAQGVAVLALYDVTMQIKLLDAADIGFDQSTYFFDQALVPIAPDSDAILTMSTHFNSNQTYTMQSILMVQHDRLQLVDKAFLFNERLCAIERQQNIHYAADPGAAKPYAPIVVTVTETATPTGETCETAEKPIAESRDIRVVHEWNAAAAKYIRDSDALEKLADANEQRF